MTMTQTPFDLNTLFDSYRDALAPVFRAQQEGLKSVERLARYQFAVAGDFLEWSLSQAKASVGPKSPADLLSEQTALNTQFSEKLRARGDELKQIATETQGVVSKWIDETSAKVADNVKKADSSVKKAA
jgi:phasin family protein